MTRLSKKIANRNLRKQRIRFNLNGTAARPRLTVTISNLHISAQLIDDAKQQTLVSATSIGTKMTGTMTEKAALVGADVARAAKAAKISKAIFDRNGKLYHGRIKALADAARENGLEF